MVERVGVLGFGEAGGCFARLARASGASVVVYDHNVARGGPKAGDKARLADEIGVELTGDVGDLVGSDVLLSVVAPRTTVAAAEAYAAVHHGETVPVWVDLNSTAPEVKVAVAEHLGDVGVAALDGVLLGGGVRLDGDEVPILVAGPGYDEVAARLRGLGLHADGLNDEVGAASALKMLRSAGIKGFEAQMVEVLIAADRYGLVEPVLASLADLFDRFPARSLFEHLLQSHADHCGRRSGEMAMVRDTLTARDVDPVMAEAALAVFERSARAPAPPPWTDERSLADVIAHLRAGMDAERTDGAPLVEVD